jgi:hypothetical protein
LIGGKSKHDPDQNDYPKGFKNQFIHIDNNPTKRLCLDISPD